MNRIINDFILELPEFELDIDSISDSWINEHKHLKRFSILKDIPSDPVLHKFVNSFDKNLFHERFKFMLIRFDGWGEYEPHVDSSRYTGINIVIRGNREKSPIKYYSDNDLKNPVFEYHYQKYPILMTSKKYHSIKNDCDVERVLFSIHFDIKHSFESLRDRWIAGEKDLFFSKAK